MGIIMRPGSPSASTIPTPDDAGVAAIVLAAGLSRRMGRPKMLLPFGNQPLLARVLEVLELAGIPRVLVVTGPEREAVEEIAARFAGARPVHNDRYESGGMLSSVQAGLSALPDDARAFLVVLGDQPAVRPETVATLVGAWKVSGAPVVLPVQSGRRGHPVLFAAKCAGEIASLPSGATLRDVVRAQDDAACAVTVYDAAIHADIDTPEDYERALREWEAHPPAECAA